MKSSRHYDHDHDHDFSKMEFYSRRICNYILFMTKTKKEINKKNNGSTASPRETFHILHFRIVLGSG